MKFNLRLLYLYLFSAVGLVVAIIGSVQLVNLGLKTFIFKEADRYYYSEPIIPVPDKMGVATSEATVRSEEAIRKDQERNLKQTRQQQAANALAMIFVGFPVYLYHWKVLQKDHEKGEAKA